ncbi:protein of unknown function [Methylacidimicrobium sp. AP8]|nr:protein of unknown function [Methylacidimicrobium sp. AP8]
MTKNSAGCSLFPTLSLARVFQFFNQLADSRLESRIGLKLFGDYTLGVKNGAVVPAAEAFADFCEGVSC